MRHKLEVDGNKTESESQLGKKVRIEFPIFAKENRPEYQRP